MKLTKTILTVTIGLSCKYDIGWMLENWYFNFDMKMATAQKPGLG